jgi:hypothetical protein
MLNENIRPDKNRKVLFVDEHGKNIVYEYGDYRIAVNNPKDAEYITLWYKEKENKWKKCGYLETSTINNGGKKFLKINMIHIDTPHRGKGYSNKLYQALIDFSNDEISGIYSYLPNRSNHKQVPKIYKKYGAKTVDGDHQFIYFKENKMITEFKLFESTLINESSFYDLSIHDILNDEFMKKFKNEDCVDLMLDWYIEEKDLEDDDKDEIEDSKEFEEYLKYTLENNFEDFYYNITDLIDDNGKISIYRAMTVDDNWLNHLKTQGKRLGMYWSWEYGSAEAHWGDWDKKNIVRIESEVNENHVNWDDTIYQNIHPNYSEEKEIRLFKNTPLKIKSIEMNDKNVDISNIKNKVFYA